MVDVVVDDAEHIVGGLIVVVAIGYVIVVRLRFLDGYAAALADDGQGATPGAAAGQYLQKHIKSLAYFYQLER